MTDAVFDPEIHAVESDGVTPKLKADGSFARKRGPRKGVSAPPRRTSAASKKAGTDYRPGLNGIFQMVAVPLAFKAPADAAAVGMHGPNISEALNELAKERPEVAAVLEKLLAVGPYGLVLSATLPLVIQILHNHDVIPEQMAAPLGAVPKKVLLAHLMGESSQEAQEAQMGDQRVAA